MVMGMGPDPEMLLKAQTVGQYINCKATYNTVKGTIHLDFASDHAEGAALIPELVTQFVNAMATQLSSYFAIKGEIIKEE